MPLICKPRVPSTENSSNFNENDVVVMYFFVDYLMKNIMKDDLK